MAGKSRVHVLVSVLLSLMMMAGMFVMASEAHAAEGLGAVKHSKQEIINYVKSHPWNMDDVKYSSEPSVTQPYSLGAISDESNTSALNYLNIYRYIAGVSEASLGAEEMEYAQAASLVCAENRKLSHSGLTKPSGMSDDMYSKAVYGAFNSNLAGSGDSLCNTILRYMLEVNGDQDFGHRRQLLKPSLPKTGFGSVKSVSGSYYSATFVDAYMNENKAISYPGQMQPIEYFGTGFAWTIVVPQNIDPASALVTVTDMKKGTVWKFRNTTDSSGEYQYMRIDDGGNTACLIFGPDDILYRDGDKYNVSITGIPTPISYDVEMFNIENIPVKSISLNNHVSSTMVGRSVHGSSGVQFTPENASNKIIKWTSSDESIASVKNYGATNYEITGHKEGTVTITGVPENGEGKVEFEFTVKPKPTGVDVPDEIVVGVGQSYTFKPTVLPVGCGASYSLYGIDSSIATMEGYPQRKITGVKKGTTQIKVSVWYESSMDDTYAYLDRTIKVTVVDPVYITNLTLDGPDKVDLGKQAVFTAKIEPANATIKRIDWSSSSSSFKNVGDGVFTAEKNPGKYTVTAKAADGSGIVASKEIAVYGKYDTPEKPYVISFGSTSVTLYNRSTAGRTYEFSVDGENWQTSPSFTGLKPNTEYKFWQRIKENLSVYRYASDVSEPLAHTTAPCSHRWDEGIVEEPATCVKKGRKKYTCTLCKETMTEEIDLVEHKYSDWEVSEEPTCTKEGTESRKCSVCGNEETRKVNKIAHNYSDWVVTKNATCTEAGSQEKTCSGCGDKITEEIPAAGHKWNDEYTVDKKPTYTEEGEESIHCSVCDVIREGSARPVEKLDPAKERGEDGTVAGPGASEACVEQAIDQMTDDSDLPGSVYGRLQLKSGKLTKTSVKITWKKVPGAKTYVIYGNKCGKTIRMKKLAVSTGKSRKFTKVAGKKVKKGTYYKFMVVAYDEDNKVVSSSKIIHAATKGGKVGNPTKLTVKKTSITLKKGKQFKLGAREIGKNIKHHRGVCYEMSKKGIVSVSKKGVIKAKKKGTCYVYAYAQNGLCKKIKVVCN